MHPGEFFWNQFTILLFVAQVLMGAVILALTFLAPKWHTAKWKVWLEVLGGIAIVVLLWEIMRVQNEAVTGKWIAPACLSAIFFILYIRIHIRQGKYMEKITKSAKEESQPG